MGSDFTQRYVQPSGSSQIGGDQTGPPPERRRQISHKHSHIKPCRRMPNNKVGKIYQTVSMLKRRIGKL